MVCNLCLIFQGPKLWIIMEYLGGGSALDLMKASKFEELHIAIVLRDVLRGLDYLHSERKVHRDIKGDFSLLKFNIVARKNFSFWIITSCWICLLKKTFGQKNIFIITTVLREWIEKIIYDLTTYDLIAGKLHVWKFNIF